MSNLGGHNIIPKPAFAVPSHLSDAAGQRRAKCQRRVRDRNAGRWGIRGGL